MIASLVLICLSVLSYGSLLNLASLSRFQEIKTQLLNFSHDYNHALEYTFDAFGHTFHLELERNTGLLHPNYLEYRWENNKFFVKPFSASPTQHCYYHGRVRGVQSSVAVSLCDGIKGLIRAYGENYVIHPHHLTDAADPNVQHRGNGPEGFHFPHYTNHIVFLHKDLQQEAGTCGVEDGTAAHTHPRASSSSSSSLSLSLPPLPSNSRKLLQSAKYVELLTVNDFARFQDKSLLTENETLSIVNIADKCYSDSNFPDPLSIVLVSQVTFTSADPYTPKTAGSEVVTSDLLAKFLAWAKANNAALFPHDSHILVSGYDFQSSTVGLAPVGGMCDIDSSGAVTQAYKYDDSLAGATLAHEMGHTLSMQHDSGTPPECPQTGYVMQAIADASAPAATHFSICSEESYEDWVKNSGQLCLNNIPTVRWGDGICGNGIVETGEQCDCGSDNSCPLDPCCNGPICRLKAGSDYQCSAQQICCTNTCKYTPSSANFKCRSASNTGCDADEYCGGQSGDCPTLNFQKPGVGCTDEYAASGECYNGECHSWTGRCKDNNTAYSACSDHVYDKAFTICQKQFCTSDGQVCFALNGTSPKTPFAEDGVPCSDGHQCLSGQCVPSSDLYSGLDPNNPNNKWGGIDVPVDVNKIVTYAAIALGIGLLLSCFWRICCNRKQRFVYVSRIRGNRGQQVPVQQQVEGAPNQQMQQREIPAAREGQGAVDVGGGLVLEFGGRSGTAVLPPGWTSHYTSDGRPYWFNTVRGETSWTFPTH